ncbi:cellulase family glycosylhydrolase [Streptomyces sp. TLI_171]|uniref:cellulase family glycosylhydrolase n=1 Tax=Streptomyces sp. TLI_171 TaxID=1938859 RepID=UPI000C197C59|nr:cellulase family glycosylhydrolase [Streptomyces sp. TLI_171]
MSVRTTTLALVSALAATAAATLALTGAGTAAAAGVQCSVDYTTNDWGSGFTANVKLTNAGASAISGWSIGYSYTGNQTLSGSGWNGTWSQSGKNVTIAAPAWATSLAAGGSVTAGANFSYSGSNAAPTSFTVNGAACNGASTPSPSASASPSPSASASPSPSASASPSPSASGSASPSPSGSTGTGDGKAPALHVAGNQLVDASGKQVVLRGVNRSGMEFMCVQGYGFSDGPVDGASIAAIKSWKANAVRVPLNEDCWNGYADVKPEYAGENYRTAVKNFVYALRDAGITPIVELHWSQGLYTGNSAGCSDVNSTCQKPMPGAGAATFWSSVATTFKNDPSVVFDMFNEPYPDRAVSGLDQAWNCWRDGGSACPGINYTVSGMQTLVNSVRTAGANNVIMLGGLAYSNDLGQWLAHKPTDPAGNLAAAWHVYNFNTCSSQSCWSSTVAPVAAQVPLVIGEIGENDCAHGFIDQVMSWADAAKVSYLGWTWNTWDCAQGPSLISNFDGTPTAFGLGLKNHLLAVN